MTFKLQLSGRGPKISRTMNHYLPPQIELPSAAYGLIEDGTSKSVDSLSDEYFCLTAREFVQQNLSEDTQI